MEAIVSVVNLHINNVELCRAGCGAIFNIAKAGSHTLCNQIFDEKKNLDDSKSSKSGTESIETAIKVMTSYAKDPVICGCGCGVLAKMLKKCMLTYFLVLNSNTVKSIGL